MKDTLNIVCLSTQLWDDPMWTNKQHVMSRLSKRSHKVLFIDPLIRVRMLLNNLILKKRYSLKRFLTFQCNLSENLWLYSPVKFLFSEKRETRFNLRRINKLINKYALTNPILWVYDPQFFDYVAEIPHKLLIYDCVDDYSQFPKERFGDKLSEILDKEQKLTKVADIIFTTSSHLYHTRKEINPHTFYTPNVADFEHNSKALLPQTPCPLELKDVKTPIVFYQGNLSSYKVDFELCKFVIEKNPQFHFVFVGPVETSRSLTDSLKEKSLDTIKAYANVSILGVKAYSDLPSYYKASAVAILPNALNLYNRSSFPMKFFEYLGGGLPVVSTKVEALKDYYQNNCLYFADNYEEFNRMLKTAVHKGKEYQLEERLTLAKNNSWDKKVDTMLEIIYKQLNAEV